MDSDATTWDSSNVCRSDTVISFHSLTPANEFANLTFMPTCDSEVTYKTAAQKIVIVALVLGSMVSVPYLFPAPLSISRSYVTGFSNRAAVILLFVGTGLFAAFTKGEISLRDGRDSKVGWRMLLLALLLTLINCLRYCKISPVVLPGGEASYFMNRLQMLAAGLVPYRQFEFVYGPLLLYPILGLERLLHLSSVQAYVLTWLVFWQIGVIMIWIVVRGIDFPIPSRRTVFGFLIIAQLATSGYGGLSYTPFRAYFSTFCIIAIYQIWLRSKSAWFVAFSSIIATGLTICCSMDQAVAVVVGLTTLMVLLVFSFEKNFSSSALVASASGMLACFGLADRVGLLEPLRSFGGGGYSYPLLPSPAIFLALFAYIVAGCKMFSVFRAHLFRTGAPSRSHYDESVVVPLTLAGCAMIPAALGRCDVLHIAAAIPAYVVGVAAIVSMPTIRRWWLPSALIFLVIMPRAIERVVRYAKLPTGNVSDPALVAQGFKDRLSDNQWYVSPSNLTASELPCDRQYFSPSFMPIPTEKFLPECLDTGYYLSFTDVITPRTIEYKISELSSHSSQPLLMENTPLEAQLPLQLSSPISLYAESQSLWVPPKRNPPLTYAPIIDYIRHHYVKGPETVGGRLRIWYPISEQFSPGDHQK